MKIIKLLLLLLLIFSLQIHGYGFDHRKFATVLSKLTTSNSTVFASPCDCPELKKTGKNKVSENLVIIWNNFDCFHTCWITQRLPLNEIKKYLGQPIWIGYRQDYCCFEPETDSVNAIALHFSQEKFWTFLGECNEFKDQMWGHPWYRSLFWNEAILDSIQYVPYFFLSVPEQKELSTSLLFDQSKFSSITSNDIDTILSRITYSLNNPGKREIEIVQIKEEIKIMNTVLLRDTIDKRPYYYFLKLYAGFSMHRDVLFSVYESLIQKQPYDVNLRMEVVTLYISDYCREWIHQGNGQWKALNPDKEILSKARSHLEVLQKQEPNNSNVVFLLLECACWMDDCEAGIYYRDLYVSGFGADVNSNYIFGIDRWLRNCPRGYWGESN